MQRSPDTSLLSRGHRAECALYISPITTFVTPHRVLPPYVYRTHINSRERNDPASASPGSAQLRPFPADTKRRTVKISENGNVCYDKYITARGQSYGIYLISLSVARDLDAISRADTLDPSLALAESRFAEIIAIVAVN